MDGDQLMSARQRWMTLALSISVVLFAAAVLRWMGRVWWCACGSWTPWSWTVQSMHNSQHIIDPYTFSHFQHGLVLYVVLAAVLRKASHGLRLLLALGIEVAWEIAENTEYVIQIYRESTISLDYFGDSVANSLADIAACMAGYAAAGLIPLWLTAAGFVVIELAMIAWIRDSLLLNVLMLVWPLEVVKQWQT